MKKREQATPLQGGTVAAIRPQGWMGVRGIAAVPPDTSGPGARLSPWTSGFTVDRKFSCSPFSSAPRTCPPRAVTPARTGPAPPQHAGSFFCVQQKAGFLPTAGAGQVSRPDPRGSKVGPPRSSPALSSGATTSPGCSWGQQRPTAAGAEDIYGQS